MKVISKPIWLSDVRQAGFTLIELIVIIVLIGAVAVTAATRFQDDKGYTEYTLQKRLISALRHTQVRALQDTRDGFCHQIVFSYTPANAGFGPPASNYAPGNEAATCQQTIDYSTADFLRTQPDEVTAAGVSMSSREGRSARIPFIGFNSLGRPLTNSTFNCQTSNGCTITFTGEVPVSVCVEEEGYIHAC